MPRLRNDNTSGLSAAQHSRLGALAADATESGDVGPLLSFLEGLPGWKPGLTGLVQFRARYESVPDAVKMALEMAGRLD